MIVTRQSPLTGKIHSLDLDITEEQVAAWQGGALIQNAFPNLNADEREFLMTGLSPEDWNAIFSKPEDWNAVFSKDEE